MLPVANVSATHGRASTPRNAGIAGHEGDAHQQREQQVDRGDDADGAEGREVGDDPVEAGYCHRPDVERRERDHEGGPGAADGEWGHRSSFNGGDQAITVTCCLDEYDSR